MPEGAMAAVVRARSDAGRLCTACGLLVLPEGTKLGDPMRRLDEHGPCASCGARDWADLGDGATVHVLRHVDATEELIRASLAQRALRRVWAGARAIVTPILIALVIGLFVESALGEIYLLPAFAGIVVLGLAVVWGAVQEIRDMRAPPTAARWSLPLPRPRLEHDAPLRGAARATGPLLRAPLSGAACLAYELAIRKDAAELAPDPTWLLLEHRNVAFELAGARIGADSVRVELPRNRVPADDTPNAGAALLRRGFYAHDTTLVIYEAVLLPGVAVEVAPRRARIGRHAGKVLRLSLLRMQPSLPEHTSVPAPASARVS